MTLYWWMHWFWITTLKLQVLSALSGRLSVRAASLPSTPIIQNGHQNGPFSNEAPTELVSSTSSSSSSTYHEDPYPGQDLVDGFITSPPPIVMVMKPQILPFDLEKSRTESQHGVTTSVYNGEQRELFPFKNSPGPHPETLSTLELGTLTYPSMVDEDLTTHTLFKDSQSIAENGQVDGKDLKAVGDKKVPPTIVGALDKHATSMKQSDKKVGKEPLLEDVPMSDGPYNPMGSFVNDAHFRSQAVASSPTLKSSGTTDSNDGMSVGTDSPVNGKTDDETKGILTNNTSENPNLLITPNTLNDSPVNTKTLGQGAENINGSSGGSSTLSSTESSFEEDHNSTLVTSDDSTFATNAAVVFPESVQKNKSSPSPIPENAKSVATFKNGHIEESTKPPSILVQSVIDESAISKGKGMDTAAITGIAFGAVVIAGLIGAVSFVLYRRRYLNKPQTLNDKCSNPDSSGYIDDSTLRENSEEMYSLDNDSFLNSLEAMTIQNYWTDNVKHTKL